jgi:hypothetical protein
MWVMRVLARREADGTARESVVAWLRVEAKKSVVADEGVVGWVSSFQCDAEVGGCIRGDFEDHGLTPCSCVDCALIRESPFQMWAWCIQTFLDTGDECWAEGAVVEVDGCDVDPGYVVGFEQWAKEEGQTHPEEKDVVEDW